SRPARNGTTTSRVYSFRGCVDMKRKKRQATAAGVIGAGLIYAMAASADPYNPGERSLGGDLLGTGTGAVTGAIAGGGHGAGIGAAVGGGLGAVAGAATTPTPPPRPSPVAITAASDYTHDQFGSSRRFP